MNNEIYHFESPLSLHPACLLRNQQNSSYPNPRFTKPWSIYYKGQSLQKLSVEEELPIEETKPNMSHCGLLKQDVSPAGKSADFGYFN
jgi:hypothetical protein